jgi:hypothetical protein
MRFLAVPCATLAALLLAQPAHAETPASAAPASASPATTTVAPAAATPAPATPDGPVITPAEPDQPVLEPIPSAHDTLGGHLVLGGSVGAKWPFGSLNDTQTQRSELGPGVALNLDLGVGLSRNVVFGAWGEFDSYSAPPECPACSAKSFAAGPFLRYHAVQGSRFDPWGALAIGLRQTNIDNGGTSTEHFFGAEFLRLSLGGDWYASSNFALGPYVELNMGVYGDGTIHTDLGTGLRLVLDFPGK